LICFKGAFCESPSDVLRCNFTPRPLGSVVVPTKSCTWSFHSLLLTVFAYGLHHCTSPDLREAFKSAFFSRASCRRITFYYAFVDFELLFPPPSPFPAPVLFPEPHSPLRLFPQRLRVKSVLRPLFACLFEAVCPFFRFSAAPHRPFDPLWLGGPTVPIFFLGGAERTPSTLRSTLISFSHSFSNLNP